MPGNEGATPRNVPQGAGGSTEGRRVDDLGVYVISVAAELAGVHPQTLRMYERKGLISPKRTSGNSRRYSQNEVEWVRQIQRLTQHERINLAGVRMILELRREIERMRAQLDRTRRRMIEFDDEPRRPSYGSTWGTLVRLRDVQSIFDRPSPRRRS
ncbi:MAG: heat shock protein transcriptional repressor HspR [Actinomycetota bacterium]